MKVLLNDPPRQREEEGTTLHAEAVRGGTGFHPLRKLLTECDIITLHVPLTRDGTDRTFHLFDRETLSEMKSDAILINTSRGEVVDNIALREALKEGSLRAAALDVWEGEPDTDPELVALTDIATPHIAGYSVDGKANATINSVRMVAAGLGLPMRGWEPDGLPQPAEPVTDLAGIRSSSREQVAKAVFHTYPIEEDDLLFRNAREKFEYLRDNYRIRREFGSYSVRGAGPEAGEILYNLGFKIIE
jgi:erythronate-4-phosphate dehydrogenase